MQLNLSELGGAVDGHEQLEPAFSCLNLSNINMEVAWRIGFNLLFYRLVAIDFRQTADVMALQTE